MGKGNSLFLAIVLGIVLTAASGGLTSEGRHGNGDDHGLYKRILDSLERELIMEKPLPAILSGGDGGPVASLYVLGGGQESLIPRFRKASSLYHQGLCKKIFLLSRPGITEYSPDLGRNLTNDEWSIRELESLKVNRDDIEAVPVPDGIFGTLSEAIRIPDVVREKGYGRLVLVTSSYHTRRVFDAFSRYASRNSLELYIYGSNGMTGLGSLLAEYLKLFLYDNFVLPAYAWKKAGYPKADVLFKKGDVASVRDAPPPRFPSRPAFPPPMGQF